MQIPMGRPFFKTPAERRGSLQAHMDELRHYALESINGDTSYHQMVDGD